ncbi:chloramphenicol 3-O phosphotransferase [Micromonospora sp. ATCC 39149]|uniref:Chloramphenicol phosphotransferase CPT n=1 Tax=Micromonospora carbonacea TaxID=47853 RepID=A0A7D5YCV8_9ACTN|nr:chloramphenicol phosphotransferase CPT [Micromonospora sp. ATCC 39149]EEP70070.1 chloramphenicol 3-O phosphotransferase [Micromonospora sp. ATCC 39149]QLJ96516.1 chloramphenicol phosphotransferase CPT [Micromonospora carbonacea]
MATQFIVLNGGSSSGKSAIVRCLKHLLPHPWISFGVDDLIDRLPPAMTSAPSGLVFGEQGEVVVGEDFLALQHAWLVGIAAMAGAGARIVLDEVFLGGAASQERTRRYLTNLEVLWVGVCCPVDIAAGREIARGDRVIGMAAAQAEIVHEGVRYDVEVDTSRTESLDCARAIAAHVI